MSLVRFTKTALRGLALFLPGKEHVKGVDVPVVNVDLGFYAGLLEVLYIGKRFAVERLAVGDEGVTGR